MGLSPTDDQIEQLDSFCSEIRRWNKAFNLVSRQDIHRLESRHILDSLTATHLLSGDRILDLGSGAGLPGYPLAVLRPDLAFTLCDRNERRTRFLRHVLASSGLPNVELLCADVDRNTVWAETFGMVLARAVSTPERLWPIAEAALEPGGKLLVFAAGSETGEPEADYPAGAEVQRHEFVLDKDRTHTIVEVTRS